MKKALVVIFAIACVAYAVAGTMSAKQTSTQVQQSLDRMTAVEAALK